MKKILISLLSILVVLSSFSVCVFADDVAHISLADISVESGKTVEMPVKISNNKGIWGLVFNVRFDTKAFEVKEVRSTGEVFNKSDIMIGPADFNDGYVRVVVTPGDVMNNNTKNGTICTIVLEQTDFTTATTYPFTFEYKDDGFLTIDGDFVSVSSTDGSVSVVDDANKPTETKKTEKPQKSTNKKADLGEVIAKAENNKIIDDYKVETEANTEQETDAKDDVSSNEKGEKENIVNLDKENDETAESIGSTGNAPVFSIYIVCALIVLGIIALIVVLVIKHKNKK